VAFLSAVFCSAAAFSLASLTSPFSVHALEQVGNNDVFGELRKVSEEKGTPHEVLHDEITVTYGIEGVWRDSIKAKLLGEKLAIDAKGIACESAGAKRTLVCTGNNFLEPLRIAHNG
jgi:hypothetical protein